MRRTKKRGGAPLPLSYFGVAESRVSAGPGADLLRPSGMGIRPAIGGRRSAHKSRVTRKTRRTRKTRGGFTPSIMGNFVASASKYITPIVLFAGYKMLKKDTAKSTKKVRKHHK
jgi:hypothetical protein